MKTIISTLSLSLALIASFATAHAAEGASVRAVLISASKEKAPADPRLAPYEATLQRNLPDSSFRFVTEGSTTVAPRRPAAIPLGRFQLKLEGGEKTADGIGLNIKWMSGKDVVMNYSSSTLQPGGLPVVLLRRPSDDSDVTLVVLTVK